MLGDKSQTMDSEPTSPKKLRKILPRPRDTQLLILNQPNVRNLDVKEPPNQRAPLPNNSPPPTTFKIKAANIVQNESNISPQNLPKILPLNASLPPLAVINRQGMKVNVVKAVWVPSSPGQLQERNLMASNVQLPSPVITKDTKVTSFCDGDELCCRLCGKTFQNKGCLIDIFGAEGKSAKLQEKVHRCLPISVHQSDKLPSTVCKECLSVLDLSFKLIITSLKTDQQLRYKLNEKKNIGGAERTDVKTSPKSNYLDVVPLNNSPDEISERRRLKPGHPSFDHTYMSRGSKADATDSDQRNETASGRSRDNGSLDTTECNLCGKEFNDIEAFLKHVESDHVGDSAPVSVKKRKAGDYDEDDVLSEISLMNCFKCREICLDDEDLQFHLNYECVVCDVCSLKNWSRRAYVLHLKKHHEITFEEIQRGTNKIANEKDATKEDESRKSKGGEEEIVNDVTVEDSVGSGHFGDGSIGGNPFDVAENGGSDEEHSCTVCHKVFRSRLNFDKHQKLHDPLGLERDRDPKMYKCDVCPRSYYRHDNLLKHKNLNHSSGRKFSCCFCEAKFNNPRDKSLHEKQEHSVAAKEAFELDPMEPVAVDPMEPVAVDPMEPVAVDPMESVAQDPMEAVAQDPMEAVAQDPKEPVALDPKEPVAVAAKPNYNRLWICGHCGKAMSTKPSLIEHERIHTGFKPFVCNVCDHSFRTKTNLNQHLVVHTGEKKFSCPICEKVFSRKSFVRQHVRSHTGEKPYVCDICGQGFSQSGDLNRHRNRHKELDETAESVVKKQKLTSETSMDEEKDLMYDQLDEPLHLSSSSDLADSSDAASDVYTMDTIACEVCSEEFQDLNELREHRFVEHGQEFQEVERAEMVSEDTLEEDMVAEELFEEEIEEEEVKEYVLVVPT